MAALNGLKIEPETAREVVNTCRQSRPRAGRSQAGGVRSRAAHDRLQVHRQRRRRSICNKCHSLGRVISQRRTREEWDLLVAMHRGWYPLVDNQAFRRGGPPPREPDRRRPSAGHASSGGEGDRSPGEAFPLKTPEWAAWSATMRPARLEGTWALSGTSWARADLRPRDDHGRSEHADEFTTTDDLPRARTGERGDAHGSGDRLHRASSGAADLVGAAGAPTTDLREGDVRRSRLAADDGGPLVHRRLRRDRPRREARSRRRRDARARRPIARRLRAGARPGRSKIYGANLPASAAAARTSISGPGSPSRAWSARRRTSPRSRSTSPPTRGRRRARSVRRRRVAARASAVYDKRRRHQGHARLGDGARRRRDVPEALAQFEAWALRQRRRRQAPTPRRHRSRPGRRHVVASRNTPRPTTTTTSSSSDDRREDRAVHAEHRRAESGAPRQRNNIGDVWVVARYARRSRWTANAKTLRGAGASAGDRAALHAFGSGPGARPQATSDETLPMRFGTCCGEFTRSRRRAAVLLSGAERRGVRARRLLGGGPRLAAATARGASTS